MSEEEDEVGRRRQRSLPRHSSWPTCPRSANAIRFRLDGSKYTIGKVVINVAFYIIIFSYLFRFLSLVFVSCEEERKKEKQEKILSV